MDGEGGVATGRGIEIMIYEIYEVFEWSGHFLLFIFAGS
jgi:hypothetical protein